MHVKEPWELVGNDICPVTANGGTRIATLYGIDELRMADGRRIVAAVNACVGISTKVLEKGRVSSDAFQLEESRADKAEQLCEDLLESLERSRKYVAFAFDQGIEGAEQAGLDLDAVIAKARGSV